MARPFVSVVIDTYNYGRFIDEAIKSTLDQDFPKEQTEILVVDDGSTDDTAERVRKYGDTVKYFRKENGGQASAFNFGIERAKGELVAFLDGDDVWMPNKLSRTVETFEKEPGLVTAYHIYKYWDPKDGWEWEPRAPGRPGDASERRKLLGYLGTPTSSLVFRASAVRRVLPVPENLRFMADAYLVGTVVFLGQVGFVEECLAKNRVHGENLWFAERGTPSVEALERRLAARGAAIEAVKDWIRRRNDLSSPKGRLVLGPWQIAQREDEFRLTAPGRLRLFAHLCRKNLVYGRSMTAGQAAYSWTHALAGLAVGKRVHYLEGVRTRVRRLGQRLRHAAPPTQRTRESA
ncbi:MAG TPA: glycosyltransferase [Candidatus Acidoferrum sp.]|nr:glycosyltransferase [Candidatus Acidoferrum sp.]